MIIVAIIAILAAMIVPAFSRAKTKMIYKRLKSNKEISESDKERLKDIFLNKSEHETKHALIKQYGELTDGQRILLGLPKPENKSAETKINIKDNSKVKQETDTQKPKVDLIKYHIIDEKDGFLWEYVLYKDNKILLKSSDRSDCENLLKLLEEAQKNGIEFGKTN
jgi:FtsZ-interacting cell division protein ZipA